MKTNRLNIIVITALLLSFSSLSHAAKNYSTAYSECLEKSGPINNSVVHGCSAEASELMKSEINRLYKVIIKDLSPEDKKNLESAQLAWLKYRKLHCDLMGSLVGSPMYSYCPMQLNGARVLELAELAGETIE